MQNQTFNFFCLGAFHYSAMACNTAQDDGQVHDEPGIASIR
jgi:hypothetical protein